MKDIEILKLQQEVRFGYQKDFQLVAYNHPKTKVGFK